MSGEKNQTELTEYYQLRKGNKPKVLKSTSDITFRNLVEEKKSDTVNLNKLFESNLDRTILGSDIESSFSDNSDDHIDFIMAKVDLNISQALKLIPSFDGTPSNLHQFLECCDIIYDDIKETDYNKFLRLMKKILIGKAYNETVKHNTYDSWEELKDDLKLRFTYVRSKLQISTELNTIRQKSDESVRDFGSRVQALVCELNDICITDAGAGSEKIVEAINAQTSLIAFQEGLNSNIRLVVKAANCKLLKDSIAKALEEELLSKRHDSVDDVNKKVKCQFCEKIGHTANNCYKIKIKNKSNVNSSIANLEESVPKKFCAYCKKPGHHIDYCRARQAAETKKQQAASSSNLANPSSSSKTLNVVNIKSNASENSKRLEQTLLNRAVRAKDL